MRIEASAETPRHYAAARQERLQGHTPALLGGSGLGFGKRPGRDKGAAAPRQLKGGADGGERALGRWAVGKRWKKTAMKVMRRAAIIYFSSNTDPGKVAWTL